MPTGILKRLGYGGSAVVDGVQVLITGGSLEQTNTPSYLDMMDIPPDNSSRSRVLHADGVSSYAGNISFDVTKKAVDGGSAIFSTGKLFKRGYSFNTGIHDGENSSTMTDCKLTNLTISGAAGGLLTATIAFMSATARNSGGSVSNSYILNTTDNTPLGYWWSGGADVKDWTFTMNQAVEPMYGNENVMTPKYLKTGLIDFTLDVNLYAEHIPDDNIIQIATASFTLTGSTTASGHHFNGITDLGTYSHSFTTAASAGSGSGGVIIT